MVKYFKVVVCADGFSMSVQAHDGSYCEPRRGGEPRYESVEVGFPSEYEPLLMPHVDGDPKDVEGATNQVYGYVPVGLVRKVIEKHGGMVEGEVPPGV